LIKCRAIGVESECSKWIATMTNFSRMQLNWIVFEYQNRFGLSPTGFCCAPSPHNRSLFENTLFAEVSVGVENHFHSFTQGSRSAPTLGWMTSPRWGNAAAADMKHFALDNSLCPICLIKLRA
jgi:hypothetical protein